MRVALVDDNADEIAGIAESLRTSGFDCAIFGSGEELIAALRRETFDLLLLDWNMPSMTGVDVLSWARDNIASPPPVIMLTSRERKEDVIYALENGAVDYIRKPEDPDIICARIKAAVRKERSEPAGNSSLSGFEYDTLTQTVRFGEEVIELRQKEFHLARLLFENLNRPLSRGYILQRVWQSSPDIETRTLDVHVSRLRSKLGLKPERGVVLRTIFGFGYRLDSCGSDEG